MNNPANNIMKKDNIIRMSKLNTIAQKANDNPSKRPVKEEKKVQAVSLFPNAALSGTKL